MDKKSSHRNTEEFLKKLNLDKEMSDKLKKMGYNL